MAFQTLTHALVNTLEELEQSSFGKFCYQLLQHSDPPQVPYSVLVEWDPVQVTELLISTYCYNGALPETVDILRQIGCGDKAHRLVELFVDRHRDWLIHRVTKVEPVLDELLIQGVIQQESYDNIRALPTSEDKMRKLFDCLLTAGGGTGKDIFYNTLEKLEPDLISCIKTARIRNQGPEIGTSDPHVGLRNPVVKRVKVITVKSPMAFGSEVFTEGDWIKVDPEVNCVDAEDAPPYSLQSEAGKFECSISGLRWVCKEKVCFKYHFGFWEEHMGRLETMKYIPGGPLLDITVISGKLDEVYLPHWICTDDSPTILDKFAVLHMDDCGDVVEKPSEVTPTHVKILQPVFSPRGVLMRVGFPVKINCKVLIYKTNKAFLTLHVYLIPRDPALQQTIKNRALSSGYKSIPKPYPEKSLKMHDRFILTADVDSAEVYPEKLKLIYDSRDPNFYEVFVENPDSNFKLTLKNESGPVWTRAIRRDDYLNTDVSKVAYDTELSRVRFGFAQRVSREVINQLLDDLSEDGVLNDEERESIAQRNNTRADRARCLIETVRRKGCEASRKMISHLQSRDQTLSTELGLLSGRPV
ncbi:NACHT, LRR and PYD domains-containing protein 1b allele 5 isoform X2 [Lates calcarifer]|uniref:NACHT, LRR and PYD domains-containing protein 1b allele 5 isoform X2 n=1 Tax=Lates calcarifer TaxID=8187 RepID=A0AAJ8DR96_LATCA|nr:NACHT, LRR and PYD domains-containing protein 1b allele 5 isoform X2 [Lates calcarifer]